MKRTTVFTCSIYPDLTRVWYHFVRRYTDPSAVTTVIYDCGSRLRAEHFPGARIVRHRNVEHGIKIDHCVRETVETPLLFLSDDDTAQAMNAARKAGEKSERIAEHAQALMTRQRRAFGIADTFIGLERRRLASDREIARCIGLDAPRM